MTVDDLIPFLCRIPGRECRYRLYRYSEPILKYLDGDQFLVRYIIDAKEGEDEKIMRSTKRKATYDEYKVKVARIRDFEMFIHQNTNFPEGYKPSSQFSDKINEIKMEFYGRNEKDLDINLINEMRKEEVENFMYIEEVSKLKKTDEINFNQVIRDLGYDDDFFRRIKCYEYGGDMKNNKGHKKVTKRGRHKMEYIYTEEDLDEMKEIVRRVYAEN
jgi:predicted DNA-binding ArsR family transcriptional regulator